MATGKIFAAETRSGNLFRIIRAQGAWHLAWDVSHERNAVTGTAKITAADIRTAFAVSKNRSSQETFRGRWYRRCNRYLELRVRSGRTVIPFFVFLDDTARRGIVRTLSLARQAEKRAKTLKKKKG